MLVKFGEVVVRFDSHEFRKCCRLASSFVLMAPKVPPKITYNTNTNGNFLFPMIFIFNLNLSTLNGVKI